MNLFDILSNDERFIVLSSADDRYIYTWNRSLTLQCYVQQTEGHYAEVEVCTLSTAPRTFEDARRQAHKWHNG